MTVTQMRPDDIVQVKNNEGYPLHVMWNSRKYELSPGKTAFIPAACAFNWFGDPRSGATYQSILDADGTRGFIPDRATEVRRLRIKWGAGLLGDESNFDGVDIPDVEILTAEGEAVITVLSDPEGKNVIQASHSKADDEQLRELVASQQRQIEAMKSHLGMNDDPSQATAQDEIPADGDDEVIELRS